MSVQKDPTKMDIPEWMKTLDKFCRSSTGHQDKIIEKKHPTNVRKVKQRYLKKK